VDNNDDDENDPVEEEEVHDGEEMPFFWDDYGDFPMFDNEEDETEKYRELHGLSEKPKLAYNNNDNNSPKNDDDANFQKKQKTIQDTRLSSRQSRGGGGGGQIYGGRHSGNSGGRIGY